MRLAEASARFAVRNGRIVFLTDELVPDELVQRSQFLRDLLAAQGETPVLPVSAPEVRAWMQQAQAPRAPSVSTAWDAEQDEHTWQGAVANMQVTQCFLICWCYCGCCALSAIVHYSLSVSGSMSTCGLGVDSSLHKPA